MEALLFTAPGPVRVRLDILRTLKATNSSRFLVSLEGFNTSSHTFSLLCPTPLNMYNSYLTLIISTNMLYFFLRISRFGLRTAVPSAVSSSSRAVASPSPALLKRRLLQCRNPAPLIRSLTHLAPTAPPLPSQAPAWPWAPALETLLCPSGARPSRPCPTPWPPPRPRACSGPHLTP